MSSSCNSEERPSQVSDKDFLWCDSNQHHCSNSSRVGRWLLFANYDIQDSNGLTELDRLWLLVKDLVGKGHLHGAKCSTAYNGKDKHPNAKPGIGVIVCYTCDYRNEEQVKEVADTIRKVTNYSQNMYYKTDDINYHDVYHRPGKKALSMYMHTVDDELFGRDHDGLSWLLLLL